MRLSRSLLFSAPHPVADQLFNPETIIEMVQIFLIYDSDTKLLSKFTYTI